MAAAGFPLTRRQARLQDGLSARFAMLVIVVASLALFVLAREQADTFRHNANIAQVKDILGAPPPPTLTARPYALAHYAARVQEISRTPAPAGAAAFFGDSLTEFGDWAALFPDQHVLNFGVGSDDTFGAAVRLEQLLAAEPAQVFWMMGTNDFGRGPGPSDIAEANGRLWDRIAERLPDTQVYVLSLLPREEGATALVTATNKRLKAEADARGLVFIELQDRFAAPSGVLRDDLHAGDQLHLNAAGYALWAEAIGPCVEAQCDADTD